VSPPTPRGPTPEAERRAPLGRLIRLVETITWVGAALVTMVVASSLKDTPLGPAVLEDFGPTHLSGPPPPVRAEKRDGALFIKIVDQDGALLPKASVRIVSIVEGKAYVAAQLETDGRGAAEHQALPRGETWILAEAAGRQRASTRVIVGPTGDGAIPTVTLALHAARKLLVDVVDERDRPLAGAEIELQASDALPFRATTDVHGRATLDRLAAPPWAADVSARGYEVVHRTLPRGNQGDAPLRVTLRKLAILTASVVDLEGKPKPHAKVIVSGPSLWPARQTETDEVGVAKIAGLPAGSYEIVALTERLVSRTLNVPMTQGEDAEVTLELRPGRMVLAKIVDAEGTERDDPSILTPIEGAQVVVVEDGISPFPREGRSGKDGLIRLGPILSRKATISAAAPGYVARNAVPVPADRVETPDADPDKPVDEQPLLIALSRGGTVRGEVRDSKGFAVEGASIEIIGTDLNGMPIDETPENAALRTTHFAFALGGPRPLLPMGELGVTVGPVPGIPRPGEQRAGADESGVVDALPPREGWSTRADGHFRANPVPPGRVRVLVRHPSYVEAVSAAVSLAAGKEATVKVVLSAGGSLRGRVKTANGQPVSGARIEVAAVHGSLVRSTLSAEDGSFSFAALPEAVSLTLARPEASDRVIVKKLVEIAEGAREEIDLVLPAPRETVTVRVTDDRQAALDNVQVSAVSTDATIPFRMTHFTRGDGILELPDAEGLALRIEVSLPGYATISRTLASAKREENIELSRASQVRGEVWPRRGASALAGAEVAITTPAGTRRARTDRDGRWVLRDLSPGPGTLVVRHDKYAPLTKSITLPPGDGKEPLELDRVELEDAATVLGEVVDKDGQPVPGARVARDAVPAYLPAGTLPRGIVLTDSRGFFSLGELPLGDVTLEAYSAALGRGAITTTVRDVDGRDRVRIVLDTKVSDDEPLSAGNLAITLNEQSEDGTRAFLIKSVVEGSEAERAGLRQGDTLVSIDDHVPSSLEDARKRLAGPVGDDVLVVVRRAGQEERLRVLRERTTR
jgi:hypothetical protein